MSTTSNRKRSSITYGETATVKNIEFAIDHFSAINKRLDRDNVIKKNVVVIWGEAGIGKTETVEGYCKKRNKAYAYIAPAQFEEMGDFIGMPRIDAKTNTTVYSKPDWVPTADLSDPEDKENNPNGYDGGILLIDDFNRADERILNGIMQLFQNYELASWKLPKGWTIVATANPEGGEYTITNVDDAMISRMWNVTMKFNFDEWIKWASEDNKVDDRFILFCHKYKELVEKTCPRSLFKCSQALAPIEEGGADHNYSKIRMLVGGVFAKSDKEIGAEFMKYVASGLIPLVDVEDIINDNNVKDKFNTFLMSCQGLKVGGLNIILGRLSRWLVANQNELTKKQAENIANFVSNPEIDNDLCKMFIQDINLSVNKTKVNWIFNHRLTNHKYNTLMDYIIATGTSKGA